MAGEHARAAPSSADRIVNCPGSLQMEERYPEDTESEHAREGTAAHWALAEVLNSRAVAVGQITPAGFVLTADMVEAAESTLRYVLALIAQHGGEQPQIYWVEQRLAPGRRLNAAMWGTPDLVIFFAGARVLYVLDFKFGRGWVEVFENWQLTAYTGLALDALGIDGLAEQSTQVRLIVDQPRSYHPDGARREWVIPQASDLRGRYNVLNAAIEEALGPNATLHTGPQCDDCRARHACPALQAEGWRGADRSRKAVPFDLSPHALGIELAVVREAIKRLEARETGLATQAETMLTRGERVPFWTIDHVPGRMAWTVPAEEVFALGDMLDLQLRKATEPITPTQAKDKGLDPGLLDAFAKRPTTIKLVRQDDASARKIFS